MNPTATIAPPGPQHMRALERANEVRLARAQLKRRVAFGETDVAEVILHCPWEADSMAVGDLLMSQPRWDEALLNELAAAMTDASICGLGQAACNPVKMVMKHFPEDLR